MTVRSSPSCAERPSRQDQAEHLEGRRHDLGAGHRLFLPQPRAGVEAIRLDNGHWALVYNDLERGRHSLALSISDDEGATWKWTRHVERGEPGKGSYHYPSLLQSADGAIHVTYTHGGTPAGSRIQHARFNEAWVRLGDQAPN